MLSFNTDRAKLVQPLKEAALDFKTLKEFVSDSDTEERLTVSDKMDHTVESIYYHSVGTWRNEAISLAFEVVDTCLIQLRDTDPRIRRRAMFHLGTLGAVHNSFPFLKRSKTRQIALALRKATTDSDKDAATAARRAMDMFVSCEK